MPTVREHRSIIFVCGLVGVALLSSIILLDMVKRTKFHGDESGWITSGYYYTDLVLRRDFQWESWRCAACGDWGSWLVTNLGKVLVGIPLRLNPETANMEFNEFYWFDRSLAWNEEHGKVPPQVILYTARRASVFLGVLSSILIFVIGYMCGNIWIGTLSVILLLSNRLFVEAATRAMTDVHYNFFLLGLCLAAVLVLRHEKRMHVGLGSILCGCFAGLAASTKESGVVLGGLFFLCVLVYKMVLSGQRIKETIQYLIAFSCAALAIIYALNPDFWPSIKNAKIETIARELRGLSQELATSGLRRQGIRERYPQLSNLSHPLNFPLLLLVRWRYQQESHSDSASWNGNRLKTFHEQLLLRYPSFPTEWIIQLVGIAAYCLVVFRSIRERKISLWSILFLYFIANYLFILVFQQVNFQRYYLPTIIASKTVTAYGTYLLATQVYTIVHRKVRERSAITPLPGP